MNYVERHFGDWARDTAHLSMLEDGAYNRLCDLYYVRETPLPADLPACCRLVRAVSKQERDAVKSVLQEFFESTPDGWTHKRCDQEIDRFRTKSGKASASAKARWDKTPTHTERNANADANASTDAMRTHSEGNATRERGRARSHSPNTNNQEIPPAARVPPTALPRAARKCPETFTVTDEMLQWAREKTPGVSVEIETEKLRDHTFRTAITDWPGAWRNWLRKAFESKAVNGAKSFRERDDDAAKAKTKAWMGSLAPTDNVIDMEDGNVPRIALG